MINNANVFWFSKKSLCKTDATQEILFINKMHDLGYREKNPARQMKKWKKNEQAVFS